MAAESGFLVVVANDGSSHGRAAVAAALAFPWPAGARARGVVARTASLPSADLPTRAMAALDAGFDEVARETRALLRKRWPEADVAVAAVPAVEAVLAEASGAGAVVVGSRGLGAVSRVVLGSVSRGIVRRAPCSVLVVKRPVRRVASLVVGVDGSAHARRAVAFVAGLEPVRAGRVTLVSVVEHLTPRAMGRAPGGVRAMLAGAAAEVNAQRDADARRILESAATQVRAAGWTVSTALRVGVPVEQLLAAATAASADVLVVGARGAGGLARLLLGSVADGVLQASPASVLIVR
jgi:nucleotide-binding universal stress UspA family protein